MCCCRSTSKGGKINRNPLCTQGLNSHLFCGEINFKKIPPLLKVIQLNSWLTPVVSYGQSRAVQMVTYMPYVALEWLNHGSAHINSVSRKVVCSILVCQESDGSVPWKLVPFQYWVCLAKLCHLAYGAPCVSGNLAVVEQRQLTQSLLLYCQIPNSAQWDQACGRAADCPGTAHPACGAEMLGTIV